MKAKSGYGHPHIVILSAGVGFRLLPFTLHRPKALCAVTNVSLLKGQLLQLQAAGFDHSVVFLSRRATGLNDWISDVKPPRFRLTIKFPRAGGESMVSLVRRATTSGPSSSILVIYGDSFLMTDFRNLLNCHQRNLSKGGLATILYHKPADIRIPERDERTYHGVLSIGPNGRVTRFVEKPRVAEIVEGFDLANAAVFIVERELLDLPAFKGAKDFSSDVFQQAIKLGIPIFGCDIGAGFRFDVGGIARWHELSLKVIRKEIAAPVPGVEGPPHVWVGNGTSVSQERIEPPVLLGDNVFVGANSRIGPNVVVGNGCKIQDGAIVEHSIIMEHCLIGRDARVNSSLIGPHSRIAGGVELPRFSVLGAYSVVGSDAWPNWDEKKGFQYE